MKIKTQNLPISKIFEDLSIGENSWRHLKEGHWCLVDVTLCLSGKYGLPGRDKRLL